MRDTCYYINNCIAFVILLLTLSFIYRLLMQGSIQKIEDIKNL